MLGIAWLLQCTRCENISYQITQSYMLLASIGTFERHIYIYILESVHI